MSERLLSYVLRTRNVLSLLTRSLKRSSNNSLSPKINFNLFQMMAIMNDSASSDGGRQSPHNIITHSFTPDSLLVKKLILNLQMHN